MAVLCGWTMNKVRIRTVCMKLMLLSSQSKHTQSNQSVWLGELEHSINVRMWLQFGLAVLVEFNIIVDRRFGDRHRILIDRLLIDRFLGILSRILLFGRLGKYCFGGKKIGLRLDS